MTDLLLDIITYLTSQNLIQGDGIDTFRDYEPEQPSKVLILYEYAGLPAPLQGVAVHRSVQIVARSESSTEAKNWSREVFDSLNSKTKFVQLTPERWSQVYLRQTPFKIKVDNKGRAYYGFNVGITTYMDKGGN